MKEKNLKVQEVYELQSIEEQIRFELFKIIQNNFTINKCENCGRLFIPTVKGVGFIILNPTPFLFLRVLSAFPH